MKFIGTVLCKILTNLFYKGQKRKRELKKCLRCLEPKIVKKTTHNFQPKNPEFGTKKGEQF